MCIRDSFPSSSRIINHGPSFELDLFFDPSFKQTDREAQISYRVEWMNKSTFKIDLEDSYILLQNPFDPTNTGGVSLAANSGFRWNEISASYISDVRKPFNYMLGSLYG